MVWVFNIFLFHVYYERKTKHGGGPIQPLKYDSNFHIPGCAESEEELQSLLMMVKEESEKAELKLKIQKIKVMASSPITSWQTEAGKVEAVTDFLFLGSKITANGDVAAMKLKDSCSLE